MALLYPLENLRLRLQVKDTSETPNQSVMEVFREIVEAEGVAGFYQGIESSLLGVAVSSGVYFFLYSAFKVCICYDDECDLILCRNWP